MLLSQSIGMKLLLWLYAFLFCPDPDALEEEVICLMEESLMLLSEGQSSIMVVSFSASCFSISKLKMWLFIGF